MLLLRPANLLGERRGKPKTGDHTLALLAVSASLAVGSGVLCLLCRGKKDKNEEEHKRK